jgi:hypothetical protein
LAVPQVPQVPLATLLSSARIVQTIEADNAVEAMGHERVHFAWANLIAILFTRSSRGSEGPGPAKIRQPASRQGANARNDEED